MFAAVKEMKLQKVAHGIMVNNIAGERIVDPNEQVSRVSRFFEGQFKSPNAQDLDALNSRPLCHPITPEEVFRAMKTLKSQDSQRVIEVWWVCLSCTHSWSTE